MLLAKTRAHAGIAIWPTGEQALANIMRIMDQARRYEARSGATSFRAFVDELEARAERDEASETPIVEEGTEGVRIMTVHRAKGLEFPIVIFADLTCKRDSRAGVAIYRAGEQDRGDGTCGMRAARAPGARGGRASPRRGGGNPPALRGRNSRARSDSGAGDWRR